MLHVLIDFDNKVIVLFCLFVGVGGVDGDGGSAMCVCVCVCVCVIVVVGILVLVGEGNLVTKFSLVFVTTLETDTL